MPPRFPGLRNPSGLSAEAQRLRASDQMFSEVMLVGILGALILSLGALFMLYATPGYLNDFFVFYNVAQRPWVHDAVYRLEEAQYFLRGETRVYAPYLYAPHFLLPLSLMRGMPWHMAEWAWQITHAIIFCIIAALPAVRRLSLQFLSSGSIAATIPDRFVQLLYILCLPTVMFADLAGQPAASASALLLLAIVWLESRPLLSGVLLAYLTYKFQLVLLVPVLLLAGHYWRVLRSYLLTLILIVIWAGVQFGWEIWPDYWHLLLSHAEVMRDKHETVIAHFYVSVFSTARHFGASEPVALVLHGCFALLGLCGMVRAAQTRNLAAIFILLASGGFLVTPYSYKYDLIPVGMAASMLVARALATPQDWKIRVLTVYLAAAPIFIILLGNQWVPDAPIYVFIVWLLGLHWVNQLPKYALFPRARRHAA